MKKHRAHDQEYLLFILSSFSDQFRPQTILHIISHHFFFFLSVKNTSVLKTILGFFNGKGFTKPSRNSTRDYIRV